jgi:hypothetical protein
MLLKIVQNSCLEIADTAYLMIVIVIPVCGTEMERLGSGQGTSDMML